MAANTLYRNAQGCGYRLLSKYRELIRWLVVILDVAIPSSAYCVRILRRRILEDEPIFEVSTRRPTRDRYNREDWWSWTENLWWQQHILNSESQEIFPTIYSMQQCLDLENRVQPKNLHTKTFLRILYKFIALFHGSEGSLHSGFFSNIFTQYFLLQYIQPISREKLLHTLGFPPI